MTYKHRIYIGYDDREKVAYQVLKYSIERHTKTPVEIIPLKHRELREQGLFKRPWLTEGETGIRIDLIDGKPFSTEFSHTRFLVPALQDYKGWALFIDADMLFLSDIKDLFSMVDDKYAVMVVKHMHEPKNAVKMDKQQQVQYGRKNWSSFIMFNCSHPANKVLTPAYINFAKGRDMHQFSWLADYQIGHLGYEYNWIEGFSPNVTRPKVVHYTEGGPWFEGYQNVAFGEEWIADYERWQREGNHSVFCEVPTIKYGG